MRTRSLSLLPDRHFVLGAFTVVLLGLTAQAAQARNIIVVTNNTATAQPLTDFLTAEGHTLTIGPFDTAPPDAATLAANDLIIVARESNSGDYDDGTEPQDWNALPLPLLSMTSFPARGTHWGWMNGTAMLAVAPVSDYDAYPNPSHSFLAGVGGTTILNPAFNMQAANTTNALPPGATVVATVAGGTGYGSYLIPAGTAAFNGRGTLGGTRVLFDRGSEGSWANITDDGRQILRNLIVELTGELPACLLNVAPAQTTVAVRQGDAAPGDAILSILNTGSAGGSLSYEIAELDANQNLAEVPWLAPNKTSGGPIGGHESDTVTLSFDLTGLQAGTYEAFLRFTDDCTPPNVTLHRVALTLRCPLDLPAGQTSIDAGRVGDPDPTAVNLTITNGGTGAGSASYTIVELDESQMPADVPWLLLDKTGGAIAAGGSDTVTLSFPINAAGLSPGTYSAFLRFTDDCSPPTTTLHEVRLVLGPAVGILLDLPASTNAIVLRSQADTDQGEAQVLSTKRLNDSNARLGYLRFDLSSVPAGFDIHAATLRLRLTRNQNNLAETVRVWGLLDGAANGAVTESNWTNTITWNTQPAGAVPNSAAGLPNANTTATLATVAVDTTLGTKEFPLTVLDFQSFVAADTNNQITLLFANSQNNIMDWASLTNTNGNPVPMLRLELVPKSPCFLGGSGFTEVSAFQGGANPPTATVTVQNVGSAGEPVSYRIAVVDEAHNPIPAPAWLSLNRPLAPALTGPIAGGATDEITLSFPNASNQPSGTHVAVLEFTDNCDPANKTYHTVTLVVNCPLTLTPASSTAVGFLGHGDPPDAFLTVQNVGDAPGSYAVAESLDGQTESDVPWLSVQDTQAGGPIAPGGLGILTLSFNITGLPAGIYTAYVRFTDQCTPSVTMTHSVTLVVSPRIPQRMAPNGLYVQRVGSSTMTWDQARVHYTATYRDHPELRTFQGTVGDWTRFSSLELTPQGRPDPGRSSVVASIGEVWLPGTDADVVSMLDNTNLGALLGTAEGFFKWLDGSDVPADIWGPGEPNNEAAGQTGINPGEDAMNLRGDGRFNDTKGGLTIGQPETRNPYFLLYEGVNLSAHGKFKVLERRPVTGTQLGNLQAAIDLLNLPDGDPGIGAQAEASLYAISFGDPGAAGGGSGSRGGWTDWPKVPFLTDNRFASPGTLVDDNDIALRATGLLVIPEAGTYTFAILHDDDIRMVIGGQPPFTPGGTGAHTLVVTFDAPGDVPIEIIHRERSGAGYLQLFAAKGDQSGQTGSPARELVFYLVGDVLGGGLAVKPPPDPCGANFADVDDDADVDQADFAAFQACITGIIVPAELSAECTCFDRDGPDLAGDGDIDDADFETFLDCWSGPDIPWTQQAQPDCAPVRP